MSVDPAKLLKGSTGRAKSDVANKLVSMLLHELSRKVNQETGLAVNSPAYGKLAAEFFGQHCPYCLRELLARSVSVEHLDGMNRFRAGLHVPGNVVVSCADCNREKRRDDQLPELTLAATGWESFLSHDGQRCAAACKTCGYWAGLFPDPVVRELHMRQAKARIQEFRGNPEIVRALETSGRVQGTAKAALEKLYRDGQRFAQESIDTLSMQVWDQTSG